MTGAEASSAKSSGAAEAPRSEPVPDAPARTVDEREFGDRVADTLDDVADSLLTDGSVVDDDVASLDDEAVTVEAPSRRATTKRSGKPVTASPVLSLPRAKHPEAVALFIHGGEVNASIAMYRGDPAYLRVIPFARDVERRSHGRIGGAVLRLAVRGWNEPEKPAVQDARWALRELRRQYPGLPLAVVGHSMGGRVALDLATSDEGDDLAAVVGLAPWASDEYEAEPFGTTPFLGIHGRQDTVTDPAATADLVERIEAAGGIARFVDLPGWHAMLWRPMRWHKESSQFLIDHLLRRGSGAPDGR